MLKGDEVLVELGPKVINNNTSCEAVKKLGSSGFEPRAYLDCPTKKAGK